MFVLLSVRKVFFFFSSRGRHTRCLSDWSSDVCSSDLQMLRTVSGSGDANEPMDEWMLDWLGRTADLLVGQAPGVAAELLTRAAASSPADSARHGRLASRAAGAPFRVRDRAHAAPGGNRAPAH